MENSPCSWAVSIFLLPNISGTLGPGSACTVAKRLFSCCLSSWYNRWHLAVKVGILVDKFEYCSFLPCILVLGRLQTFLHFLQASIDSGAKQNFLDKSLATELCLPLEQLPKLLQDSALNGSQQ